MGPKDIPDYLRTYIVQQDPSLYTPMDHASWRYILKIAQVFFARHAHPLYLNGLRETGISTERIPLISEMDEKLSRFGWRAVAVSGFIPPAVFMEFLARGILPIACDMRKIENLAYTPAPDIVHEAAGHAPIIADPAYADYLHHYGELAEKAIYSSQDLAVYEGVKLLSDTKEDPRSTPAMVAEAQRKLDAAIAAVDHDSEATQLGRMGWWTIEYGLLGTPDDPKIYGAGLLSSVGESFECLKPHVRKVPFSVDCVNQSYDITKPQPQLFIAPDFEALKRGLAAFAATMAYKMGGLAGLEKARKAATTTTAVYDSGVQVSGTLAAIREHRGEPAYLSYQGPTQLAFTDKELDGQGPRYHGQGFGSPVGRLKGLKKSPADLTIEELKAMPRLEFESGVIVEGRLVDHVARGGRNLILVFHDCTVRLGDEVLFRPEWGTYDMTCGSRITTVFGGAADRAAYLEATGGFKQDPGKPKTNLTPENRALNDLYARVRRIREAGPVGPAQAGELATIHAEVEARYPEDWLLRYELLELDSRDRLGAPWAPAARAALEGFVSRAADGGATIRRGLELL